MSIYCTRATKVLIFGSAAIGELFLTATFIDSGDSTSIEEDKLNFVRHMFSSVFFAIGVTILLKLIYQFFLKGKVPYRSMSKIEADQLYSQNNSFYNYGLIIMTAFSVISIWRVVACTSEFTDTAMAKWLYIFLCCIAVDIFVIDVLKIFLKLIFNFAFMHAVEINRLQGTTGKKIAKAISSFYFYFT